MFNNIFGKITAMIMAIITGMLLPVTPVDSVKPSENTTSQDVTIMAYNVYVAGTGNRSPENRTPLVAEMIRKYMPDSFGLEEADEGWLKRLSEALPEYAYVGHGRDRDLGGEATPVFYLKDKYELVDSDTFWISKTPEKPSYGWDASFRRVCTYAVLKNKETGFTYAHFSMHFDVSGSIARCQSVALVTEKAAEVAPGIPVIMTGDLNAKEDTLMYSRMLESGLQDTKYIAKTADSGRTYNGYDSKGDDTDKVIDYIFVNNFVKEVESYTIDRSKLSGIYPSDHYPLISKMTLINSAE